MNVLDDSVTGSDSLVLVHIFIRTILFDLQLSYNPSVEYNCDLFWNFALCWIVLCVAFKQVNEAFSTAAGYLQK